MDQDRNLGLVVGCCLNPSGKLVIVKLDLREISVSPVTYTIIKDPYIKHKLNEQRKHEISLVSRCKENCLLRHRVCLSTEGAPAPGMPISHGLHIKNGGLNRKGMAREQPTNNIVMLTYGLCANKNSVEKSLSLAETGGWVFFLGFSLNY